MILQALIILAARPDVGAAIAYDVRVTGGVKSPTSLSVRVTERIERVQKGGVLEATRTYSHVSGKGDSAKGIASISGKRDRYLVSPTGVWKPATENVELGFPDFELPAQATIVGETWEPGQNLRGVRAALAETTTIAGRRAAVIRFRPKTDPPADRIGAGSYWAMDLHDGRPLLARLEMLDQDPERTGIYTIIRRDVPGLAREIPRFAPKNPR